MNTNSLAKPALPLIKPSTHTSFGPLKHINARRAEYRLRRSRSGRRPGLTDIATFDQIDGHVAPTR
jgi:hypothetical protein